MWKQIRAYNTTVSANLARNIIPELDITEIEPIAATTVAELVKKTNEALKINNENLNNIADTNNKILTRTSEAEQKIIRINLE